MPSIKPAPREVTELGCGVAAALPVYVRLLVHLAGVLAVVFLCTASLLPAYHLGLEMQYGEYGLIKVEEPWSYVQVNDQQNMLPGLLLPLLIIVWMLSASLLVLFAKWLVIGRHYLMYMHDHDWL